MRNTDEQVRGTKKSKRKKKKQKYKTSTQRFTSRRLREEVPAGRAEPAVQGAELCSGQTSFEASLMTQRKGPMCQDENQDRVRGERSRWGRRPEGGQQHLRENGAHVG